MQFTTHILLSNNEVVGSWTLPTEVAVLAEPARCTWVDAAQLHVNLYLAVGDITGVNQFQQLISEAITKWLSPQVPDISLIQVDWRQSELLIAGLRYPKLTQSSWEQMAAYAIDSLGKDVTPLWLSQFGIVVERDKLTRGNHIECVCDDKVAEVHGRYGAVMHHHGTVDRPREFFEDMVAKVIGERYSHTPLPGTPVYTGCTSPFQYQMQLSHEAMRKELRG